MAGDSDRFSMVLKQRGPRIATVILTDVVGGSGEEAWKIGRLIRDLRLMTAVGWAIASHDASAIHGTSPTIYYPEAAVAEGSGSLVIPSINFGKSICASACVDIWVAGYYRFGDAYLGVHRPVMVTVPGPPAVESELPKTLEGEMARWSKYLADMGAPSSLIETAMAVPNEKIKLLDRPYVESALLSRSFSDEFWMLIHCGSFFPDTHPVWKGTISMERVAALSQCAADHLQDQRIAAWASVFGS